jgi:uncharacterized membrane protein YphA (DoxX/SURF4 family)
VVDVGVAALRILLGAILILAGAAKIAGGTESFERIVRAYGIRHPQVAPAVSLVLPPIELAIGFGLLLGIAAQLFPVAAEALLLVFSGALAYALHQGYRGSCGCLGRFSAPVSRFMVRRNLFLTALTVPVSLAGGGAFLLGPALPSISLLFPFALAVPASALVRRHKS